MIYRARQLRWLTNDCLAAGHGKPMDIWAMGVITHFLLTGYTPFDRENQQLTRGRTDEYWANVSQTAKEFVTMCLTVDPAQRPTASEVLKHRWLAEEKPHYPDGVTVSQFLSHSRRLDARTRCECPVLLFLNTLSRSLARDINVQSAVPYGVLSQ